MAPLTEMIEPRLHGEGLLIRIDWVHAHGVGIEESVAKEMRIWMSPGERRGFWTEIETESAVVGEKRKRHPHGGCGWVMENARCHRHRRVGSMLPPSRRANNECLGARHGQQHTKENWEW